VKLTAVQVRQAVERGLCEKVRAKDLPDPFVSFGHQEAVGLGMVLDRNPAFGRLIVHPKRLNDLAPPPRRFFFPSPFHIVRSILGGMLRMVRCCDGRAYYWQFLAPPALRDAMRFWFGGCTYRFLRIPMGIRHSAAGGQSFFLWHVD
jgi:hypothetical protein